MERVLIGQLVSPGAEEEAGKWSGTPPELASPSQSVRTVLGSLGGRSSTLLTKKTIADLLVCVTTCSGFHLFFEMALKMLKFLLVLSGMHSAEVQEDLREAANNLVKHFHKPEQEVRFCDVHFI